MTRSEVIETVIKALRETQRASGRDVTGQITETTVPIRDLDDFDSHNGIEATVALEEQLGRSLPDNLFVDEAGRRALSVGEAVDRVLGLLAA